MASLALAPEEPTNIALIVEHTPQIVLLEPEKYDSFYAYVKGETEKLVPDTGTAKGRDAIRKTASDVTKSKTAIEKARLDLTAEWRERTNQVNEAGKKIKADLEALAIEVRRPLTEWEEAEKARKERCESVIAELKADTVVTLDDTSATVKARGKKAFDLVLDASEFGSLLADAQAAKDQAVSVLLAAMKRLTKEEVDRAELERLRAEAAEREAREQAERQEREARERAEREAREAKERADAEAKAAEERRAAAEKAEQDRIAHAAQEAEDRAKRQAEADAQAERDRVQREHEAQLAAERKKAADEAAAKQAELDRLAKIEADRMAEEKRIADEKAKREADQAHRTAIKTAAKTALMTCGADEETARKIVVAILAGEIPAVRLEF